MSNEDLQLLLDRQAISDVVHAYATGLDRRDWALFRSIFADQIEMNFDSAGLRSGSYSADDWVRSAERLFANFSATQHTSSNHVHDIRGDVATCTSNMQAEHFILREEADNLAESDARFTLGGYYVNELARQSGGWKLVEVTLNVTWLSGNPDIGRIAARRRRAADAPR